MHRIVCERAVSVSGREVKLFADGRLVANGWLPNAEMALEAARAWLAHEDVAARQGEAVVK